LFLWTGFEMKSKRFSSIPLSSTISLVYPLVKRP
jgi:hypothetical protein